MNYYSQDNQDKFLEENFFKGFKNGFYIDIGAHDGITFNNTLFFQNNHNWNGINIEPNLNVYNKLIKNRPNDININCAICNNNGNMEFIVNTGYTEMLSGLKNNYDIRHENRLKKEIEDFGGDSKIIEVTTKKLENICDDYNINNINYISIDVEGAEFEVIKSINFEKIFIDVISFECNFEDKSQEIIEYLKSKNYIMIKKSQDIFMIHKYSQFITTKNIIFVGSNNMNEIDYYVNIYNNGIFIEADKNIFNELDNKLKNISKTYKINYTAVNELITNENNKEYNFNIFNNNSGSSSIYKSNNDKWCWNGVKQIDIQKCNSKKMSMLIEELNWENKYFDVIIDVQGAELEVLKSFDKYINNINCIQVECSKDEYYLGQVIVDDLNEYLLKNNFVLINRIKNDVDTIKIIGQGDLIYARNKNIKTIFKNYQESI